MAGGGGAATSTEISGPWTMVRNKAAAEREGYRKEERKERRKEGRKEGGKQSRTRRKRNASVYKERRIIISGQKKREIIKRSYDKQTGAAKTQKRKLDISVEYIRCARSSEIKLQELN